MHTDLDKNTIKEYLKEVIEENPYLLKNVLKEIANDSKESELFDYYLKRNFEKYDLTFKALA